MDEVRLGPGIWLGLLGVGCLAGLVWAVGGGDGQGADGNTIGAGMQGLLFLLGGLGTVFLVGAMGYAGNWLVWTGVRRLEEGRRAMAVTPQLEIMRAAARLTPEQARLVPIEMYRAEVEMVGTREGPRLFLRMPGGVAPLEFVEDFLRDCSMTQLRAIRTYADGSVGREYARLITDWLVWVGLAVPAVGPRAAMWIDEQAKSRASSMIYPDLRD